MIGSFRRLWLIPAVVIVVVIALDQITKAWVLNLVNNTPGTSIPVLGDWLYLTYVRNTGVAFGMFQSIPNIFVITSLVISIGALYFYRYHLPHHYKLVQICIGAIIGGALGNVIDRLRQGYVDDFVHVVWFPGIFNFADSCITCGVIALAVFLMIKGDENMAPATATADALPGDGKS